MRGMNQILWYDQLSTGDVENFQDKLIEWAQRYKAENAIMLFNKSSLDKILAKLDNTNIIVYSDNYIIVLPKITIEFSCICGEICFLQKISKNDSADEKILYANKGTLTGALPWYAF